MRSTAAPYTESRLTRSVANERVGFPVVEHRLKLHDESFYRDAIELVMFASYFFIFVFWCSSVYNFKHAVKMILSF